MEQQSQNYGSALKHRGVGNLPLLQTIKNTDLISRNHGDSPYLREHEMPYKTSKSSIGLNKKGNETVSSHKRNKKVENEAYFRSLSPSNSLESLKSNQIPDFRI